MLSVIYLQTRIRWRPMVGVKVRFGLLRDKVPFPPIAVADPAKERVAMEAFQLPAEIRLARLEVANRANNNRVLCGDVQDPLIILEPRTALDLNRADDAEPLRNAAIPIGQCRL